MAKQNIFAKRAGHPDQQTARRANQQKHRVAVGNLLRAGSVLRMARFIFLLQFAQPLARQ
jgi:hypothetical protein